MSFGFRPNRTPLAIAHVRPSPVRLQINSRSTVILAPQLVFGIQGINRDRLPCPFLALTLAVQPAEDILVSSGRTLTAEHPGPCLYAPTASRKVRVSDANQRPARCCERRGCQRNRQPGLSHQGTGGPGGPGGRQGQFAPDMVLFCERFAVVELIAQQPWPALPVI